METTIDWTDEFQMLLAKADFQRVKAFGLNAVRLPFGYWVITEPRWGTGWRPGVTWHGQQPQHGYNFVYMCAPILIWPLYTSTTCLFLWICSTSTTRICWFSSPKTWQHTKKNIQNPVYHVTTVVRNSFAKQKSRSQNRHKQSPKVIHIGNSPRALRERNPEAQRTLHRSSPGVCGSRRKLGRGPGGPGGPGGRGRSPEGMHYGWTISSAGYIMIYYA